MSRASIVYANLDAPTLRWAAAIMQEEQLRERRSSAHYEGETAAKYRQRELAFKSAARILNTRASLAEKAKAQP